MIWANVPRRKILHVVSTLRLHRNDDTNTQLLLHERFLFMARKFTSLMTVEQVMWLFYFKEMCFSTSSPKLVVNGMEIWYDFKIILQIHHNLINQDCSWWECGRITMYTYIIFLGINNNAEWDRVAHICFTKLTSIGQIIACRLVDTMP